MCPYVCGARRVGLAYIFSSIKCPYEGITIVRTRDDLIIYAPKGHRGVSEGIRGACVDTTKRRGWALPIDPRNEKIVFFKDMK
jgi:hypothetical protein